MTTGMSRPRKWLWRIVIALLLLASLAVIARHFATEKLRQAVESALGPNAEVASIETAFSSITLNGIRIKADKDWPAVDELAARRVVVRPDWGALVSRTVRIASIEVEGGYVSMLRRKDGNLALLPSLLGGKDKARAGGAGAPADGKSGQDTTLPEIIVSRVLLSDTAVDFYDASIRQPAHRLRLEQTTVTLGAIRLPALTGRTDIAVDGVIKGVRRDGRVALKGWAEIATRDSEMQTTLSGVDLVAFQPYLIKAAETGVKKGTLDLSLKSTVKKNRLHAPGRVTLSGLELTTGKTFMGMPREAVVAMMKDKKGQITADFVLEGNIDDPKFSLNEKFLSQIGTATANVLGISLEGLARGIGSAGAGAASGIGGAINKLLGPRE
jgi:hypothetical protein